MGLSVSQGTENEEVVWGVVVVAMAGMVCGDRFPKELLLS